MKKTLRFLTIASLAVLAAGCKPAGNDSNQKLAEAMDARCPIIDLEGELVITNVESNDSNYQIDIKLGVDAPVSVRSLRALDEEYDRMIDELGYDAPAIGGVAYVKGLVGRSRVLAEMINEIAEATDTEESTQGWIPVDLMLYDDQDSISYGYNEEWGFDANWMDGIMPVEMRRLKPVNDVVRVAWNTQVSDDGVLRIGCFYYADPYNSSTGEPMRISEVMSKYFNEDIAQEYLRDLMEESPDVSRFLKACDKQGVKIRFVVDGSKDAIDYDLAEPAFINEWESWGGTDSITVSLR